MAFLNFCSATKIISIPNGSRQDAPSFGNVATRTLSVRSGVLDQIWSTDDSLVSLYVNVGTCSKYFPWLRLSFTYPVSTEIFPSFKTVGAAGNGGLGQNGAHCCTKESGDPNCIRTVRTRSCEPKGSACTPVPYQTLHPLVSFDMNFPMATTVMRAESFGYVEGMPCAISARCAGSSRHRHESVQRAVRAGREHSRAVRIPTR